MIADALPYLLREPSDLEAQLGTGLINLLASLGGEGMTDATGEIALMCALAIYAEHRREMRDPDAIARITDGARRLFGSRRFAMRVGDDFTRMVQGEHEAGRLKS